MLVDASQKGDPLHAAASAALLTEFGRNPQLHWAIDRNGFILNEYDGNINGSMFASQWLKAFAAKQLRVDLRPFPRPIRVRLDDAHFSQPDRRFVQVALLTNVRVIVTRDPDYSPEVIRTLHEFDIRVLDAHNALAYIRALPADVPAAGGGKRD